MNFAKATNTQTLHKSHEDTETEEMGGFGDRRFLKANVFDQQASQSDSAASLFCSSQTF